MDSDDWQKSGEAAEPVEIYVGHRRQRRGSAIDPAKLAELEVARELECTRELAEWHERDAPRFLVEVTEPIRCNDWDDDYRFCRTTISTEIVRVVEGERFGESFYTANQDDVVVWKSGARFVWASRREIETGAVAYAGNGSSSHPFEVEFAAPEDVVFPREWCEPRAFGL